MQIGLLVEYLGPRGGTEEYIRAVSEGLLAGDQGLDLLYEQRTAIHGADWERFVDRVRSSAAPARARDRREWLAEYLSSARPDLLYVHNISFVEDVMAVAAGKVPIVRYIHDFRPVCLRTSKVFPVSRQNCDRALGVGCLLHGCSIGPGRGGALPVSWNHIPAKLAERNACRRMDRVIVASGFMRDLLLRNGFSNDRIIVLPYFCPLPQPVAPLEFSAGSRLLFVGQIEKFKGLSVLLSALRLLPPSVTLDVAGDGPWRGPCEAQVEEGGLRGRVTFHGWTDRDRLSHLMGQIQILVVPSIWNEPFGIVGLEAMLHARPVVAFDVGGIRDWLVDGATGVLVKDIGAEPLARAIGALCDDPATSRTMGMRGYHRVREKFTADRHIEVLLSEFQAIVERRAGVLS